VGEIDLSALIEEERRAEELVKRAEARASEILRRARERAKAIVAELGRVDEEEVRRSELERLDRLLRELEARYRERIEALKSRVASRWDEAVDLIVAYLLGGRPCGRGTRPRS